MKNSLSSMPPTDDRQLHGVGDYLESNNSWLCRNAEAASWFIDNHDFIRIAVSAYVDADGGLPIGYIPMPRNVDEARAMTLLGENWLRSNTAQE